jgi:glycosyltransferase involved in cell wall biosynthesis
MIAGWASYKRHWAFFRALKTLRRVLEPRVALVGYPLDTDVDAIMRDAKTAGVDDLIEVHERLSPAEVNAVLNRSKVNVLWSRREGVNRAIIEGMAAGVPCVLRSGFNYGYRYPYINVATGCYASDHELPDVLERMIRDHASYSPRRYFLEHLTPHISTATLNAAIRTVATERGERWTEDLAVRVSALDGLAYWDPADRQRFEDDYRFLEAQILG